MCHLDRAQSASEETCFYCCFSLQSQSVILSGDIAAQWRSRRICVCRSSTLFPLRVKPAVFSNIFVNHPKSTIYTRNKISSKLQNPPTHFSTMFLETKRDRVWNQPDPISFRFKILTCNSRRIYILHRWSKTKCHRFKILHYFLGEGYPCSSGPTEFEKL